MTKALPLDNTYCLLAHFLAPNKSPERRSALQTAITDEQIEWGPLVLQANIQMCTPLWYARLKQDDLLQHLPQDLQEYLQVLYESNRERNEALKAGLEELLAAFEKAGINSILLKGAATFVDDLYGAPGARYMGDLDILVPDNRAENCETILENLGYEEQIEDRKYDNLPTDERHHHINRRFRPESPNVIEIHFKPAYGQGGRILTTENAWDNLNTVSFKEEKTAILNPHYRLLHNTLHAIIPHREFISGNIQLAQIAEFSALINQYPNDIDWDHWYQCAINNQLEDEFITYLELANQLMETPKPEIPNTMATSPFHHKRIITTGASLSPSEKEPGPKVSQIINKSYYALKLPQWMWNNTCYAPGIKNLPARLTLMFRKMLDLSTWKKI